MDPCQVRAPFSGILARRRANAPKACSSIRPPGIAGIAGFPPGLFPSQGAEEDGGEKEEGEEEEEWKEEEEGEEQKQKELEFARRGVHLIERGEQTPLVKIWTRGRDTDPKLPKGSILTINANGLWLQDKGAYAWHTGLHSGVWTPMLKSPRLPDLLVKVHDFLQHQRQKARDSGRTVDLHLDIFCSVGKHRSVGFSVMLQYLLGQEYQVEVKHMQKDDRWACFRSGDCWECLNSEVDLKEGREKLDAFWNEVRGH